jgi:hypothetical protein
MIRSLPPSVADKDRGEMGWMRVVWALSGAWLLLFAATVSAQSSDANTRAVDASPGSAAEPVREPPPKALDGATQAKESSPQPQPADEPAEVSERFMQAMGLFAMAGAGGITFTVAGALALKEDNALAQRCGRDAGRTCTDDDLSALRTRSRVADVGLGVLVVSSLVGVTLWWLDRRDSARRAATLRPVASFDRHGGQLALGGRF